MFFWAKTCNVLRVYIELESDQTVWDQHDILRVWVNWAESEWIEWDQECSHLFPSQQLKEMCRRELERAEQESSRNSAIIADYKQVGDTISLSDADKSYQMDSSFFSCSRQDQLWPVFTCMLHCLVHSTVLVLNSCCFFSIFMENADNLDFRGSFGRQMCGGE